MKWLVRLFLVVALCAALGCTTAVENRSSASTLVWPSEPAPPRIVFVQTLVRPADFGIEKNFFAKLVDFIFGETPARLVRPMAVLDVDGVLYVADPGVKGVHRFDRASGSYELIQLAEKMPMLSPVGLARGENNSVLVADSALAGVFLIKAGAKFAVPVVLDQKLGQPTGIAFDVKSRKLYVVDTNAHCIRVFGGKGELVATMGQRGTDDGDFNFPTMLWQKTNGQLLVTDSLNFRTQIFDEKGRFQAKFGRAGDGIGDSPRQKGVAADRFGHIYVVDAVLHGVQIFDGLGQLLLSIGGLGDAPGEFRLPSGIFIGTDDMIYVADAYNQRVQVFKYVGGST